MAIQANFTLDSGLAVSAAYMRVTDIVIKKSITGTEKSITGTEIYITYGVEGHASQAKREAKAPTVISTRYKLAYDNTKEAYAQVYAHLKTLYPGSTDV